MRKIFHIFAMTALIVALIGMWLRFAPVTTEAVTAAEVQPLSNAIYPFELTLKNGTSLPDGYHGGDYTHVYRNR
jgi:hypothetical protein